MLAVRAQRWLSLVAAAIALSVPISLAHSQQRLPGFFGIVGAIINSAIVDSARREWQNRTFADYNCLAGRNLSAAQLAAQGIGPNDPQIRRLLYECAHAQRFVPERTEPQHEAGMAVGPYNPNFVVDGLSLGGEVYPDSAVYKSYSCQASVDFAGFTWCAVHHTEEGKFGPYTSSVTILHSSDKKVAFITQATVPAFFRPGDVDREIRRLSRGFGQAQILNADPRPGVPHAVLAAWGAVTLTPLDEAAMEALRRGEQIHRGLVAEFIGDTHKSARIGLPVYGIGGGPGYLWGASFDDAGKGSLRISAVDASAIGPPQPPSVAVIPSPSTPPSQEPMTQPPGEAAPAPAQVAPAPEPQPPSQAPTEAARAPNEEAQSPQPSPPSGSTTTGTWCSLLTDATQRQACDDKATGGFSAPPLTSQPQTSTDQRTPAQRERGCAVCVPDQSSPAQSEPANSGKSGSIPSAEQAVISAVQAARQAYNSGSNDLQKGAARVQRGKGICQAIPDRRAIHWIGKVSALSSNGEGKGVLAIEIADGIQVKTWSNAFSDAFDDTLIGQSSPVFKQVQTLTVGERVQFSGVFPADDNDCIKEPSLTLEGSISEPDFIIKFTEIMPIEAAI